jgi:hyperosmotically inducible periplasmic protein
MKLLYRELASSRKYMIVLCTSAALGVSAAVLAAPDAAVPEATDHSATVADALSDTAVTGRVKTQFATDERLKGSDISVKTNNGVVTLTGTAASSSAKEAAETLASNVSGVRSVNNQIVGPSASSELGSKAQHAANKTSAAIEDTAVTADIKAKYATDSKTRGSDISVKTDHSIVALSGTVVSEAQKSHVIYVARHAKGVTQVDSTALSVAPASAQ